MNMIEEAIKALLQRELSQNQPLTFDTNPFSRKACPRPVTSPIFLGSSHVTVKQEELGTASGGELL